MMAEEKRSLVTWFDDAANRLLTSCIRCGRCVSGCRVMQYTDVSASPAEIQSGILDFLAGRGQLSSDSHAKVNACMRCYGCFDVPCPIGLDSLTINELVHRREQLSLEHPWSAPLYPDHDARCRAYATPEQYERITTPKIVPGADVLFFPGCNIYRQPDKVLALLDVMDAIGLPYSFAPGVTYCCGMAPGRLGHVELVQAYGEKLLGFIRQSGAHTVVLWCATCLCHTKTRIKRYADPQEKFISFGQYVLKNLDRLNFLTSAPRTVTFHEPCKTSYMGLDIDSIRMILKAIPGVTLREMEHHGKNTMCCGSTACNTAPSIGTKVSARRLDEARATGADTLIDQCHACHIWLKKAQGIKKPGDVDILNFASFLAKSLGFHYKDSVE